MKTQLEVIAHFRQVWQESTEQARREAFAADPATGGNPQLCHNWGNAGAKQAWAEHYARTKGNHAKEHAMCNVIEHAEHVARNEHGQYLWCDACQGRIHSNTAQLEIFSLA